MLVVLTVCKQGKNETFFFQNFGFKFEEESSKLPTFGP
jgi:hypothetical protein